MLPIRDVAELRRGVRVVKEQLSDEGAYPVYQNSMTPLGYFEKGNCLPDTTFVIAAGAAGEVGYSRTAFWAADDCYYFECTDLILSRFLYHLLQKKNALIASKVRKASIPRLPRIALENMMIAIPSVEEQQRIVSILDRFDIIPTPPGQATSKRTRAQAESAERKPPTALSSPPIGRTETTRSLPTLWTLQRPFSPSIQF